MSIDEAGQQGQAATIDYPRLGTKKAAHVPAATEADNGLAGQGHRLRHRLPGFQGKHSGVGQYQISEGCHSCTTGEGRFAI